MCRSYLRTGRGFASPFSFFFFPCLPLAEFRKYVSTLIFHRAVHHRVVKVTPGNITCWQWEVTVWILMPSFSKKWSRRGRPELHFFFFLWLLRTQRGFSQTWLIQLSSDFNFVPNFQRISSEWVQRDGTFFSNYCMASFYLGSGSHQKVGEPSFSAWG